MVSARPNGLLLGAGASCEIGMPLVWQLSEELRRGIQLADLRALNRDIWLPRGDGYPLSVVEEVYSMLDHPDVHYEALLGYLEAQQLRGNENLQHYHGLRLRLIEIVYHILLSRHLKAPDPSKDARRLFGIAALARTAKPLWVFSLNHDMFVEMMAAEFRVVLNTGFEETFLTIPTTPGQRGVRARVMSADEINQNRWRFLAPGDDGINLLKIHGSLDMFAAFRSPDDLLRIEPELDKGAAGVLAPLRLLNEHVGANLPFHFTNGLVYEDAGGALQFLKRSIVSGVFKFIPERSEQVLPPAWMNWFRNYLAQVNTLAVVGYGLGDIHINTVLREWLEIAAHRTVQIVSPDIKAIPAPFLHLAPQVTLVRAKAIEYFSQF